MHYLWYGWDTNDYNVSAKTEFPNMAREQRKLAVRFKQMETHNCLNPILNPGVSGVQRCKSVLYLLWVEIPWGRCNVH